MKVEIKIESITKHIAMIWTYTRLGDETEQNTVGSYGVGLRNERSVVNT